MAKQYYVAFYASELDGIGGYKVDTTPTIESKAYSDPYDAINNFLDYCDEDKFAYLLEVSSDDAKRIEWEF